MKSNVRLFLATLGAMLFVAASCTKNSIETPETELVQKTCTMKLVGSLSDFDTTDTKADGDESTWADGSIIYLRMDSDAGTTFGEATYDLASNLWTVNYYGALNEERSTKCIATFVEDKIEYNGSMVTVDEKSAIFEDTKGTYIYTNGELVVTANLKPKTGRVRFSGKANSVVKVYGVTHYTHYNIDTDTYSTSAEPVKLTVGADGYTPYIYGYFTDAAEPTFKVWVDAAEAYTKYCSSNIFQAGQSGKLTIPTAEAHNGWIEGLHFNVNGARFKMVAVEGGTFVMGVEDSTNEYLRAHNVTLTGYCIAETEMTYLLWSKIESPDNDPNNPNVPYPGNSSMSWSIANSKVSSLNKITSANFDLPTEAQWEFAAKGGNKSKGYVYSGSDNIDEVAWYKGNSSSKVHDVKQKMPNELGIYDMTGNVGEWTKDYHAQYPTTNQTDPYVDSTNSSQVVSRGGEFTETNAYCKNTTRFYIVNNSSRYYTGIRLALNWN